MKCKRLIWKRLDKFRAQVDSKWHNKIHLEEKLPTKLLKKPKVKMELWIVMMIQKVIKVKSLSQV